MTNTFFKKIINLFLAFFDISIIRYSRYLHLKSINNDIVDILNLESSKKNKLLQAHKNSKSQHFQDLFVLLQTNFKKKGFYVDFGATNGLEKSNTHILEKKYKWTGILVEPAKLWHQELYKNRKTIIDTRCVWKKSNIFINFNEVNISPELSTIDSCGSLDGYNKIRRNFKQYPVKTVSLVDLLHEYKAPKIIDYLSIDTEGSEYEILKSFDFSKFEFRVITCEHNFTKNTKKLRKLLENNGYRNVYLGISREDLWFVKKV
jgi:FkbM family methyltransferase